MITMQAKGLEDRIVFYGFPINFPFYLCLKNSMEELYISFITQKGSTLESG